MYYCSKCGAQSEFMKCPICGSECSEKGLSGGNIKGKILDNLYTLRAGISEISRKHDQIGVLDKKKEENRNLRREKNSGLSALKKKYQNAKTVVENHNEEKNNAEIEHAKQTIQTFEKEKAVFLKRNSIFRWFGFFVVLTGAITLLGSDYWPESAEGLWWVLMTVEVILFIVFSKKSASDAEVKKFLCRMNEQIDCEKETISLLTKKHANYIRCRDALVSYPSIIETAEHEISLVKPDIYYDEQISNLASEGKYIYQTLIDQFNGFLNVQDWKYLDVVIYMFETSRASSIQDALRQTDALVRHGELISMMKEVGTRICSTIQSSTRQISFRLDMLENSQRNLYSGVAELGGKMQGVKNSIISASNMQAALLEKANTNSERIMEDVHQLRKYADDLIK